MRTRLRTDDGFTLVELVVVVTIIAVLLAIAIPSVLGARKRSQDRAAQSTARNAVTEAMTIFTDNTDYRSADQPTLQSEEPTLHFVGAAASTDANEVSTATACVGICGASSKHHRFVAAVLSESGTCWFAQSVAQPDAANPGLTWEQAIAGTCDAASAPAYDSATAPNAWAGKPGASVP